MLVFRLVNSVLLMVQSSWGWWLRETTDKTFMAPKQTWSGLISSYLEVSSTVWQPTFDWLCPHWVQFWPDFDKIYLAKWILQPLPMGAEPHPERNLKLVHPHQNQTRIKLTNDVCSGRWFCLTSNPAACWPFVCTCGLGRSDSGSAALSTLHGKLVQVCRIKVAELPWEAHLTGPVLSIVWVKPKLVQNGL